MRIAAIAAAVSIALAGLAAADEARAAIRKTTNIPEQKLGSALRALAKDRNLQVLFRSHLVRDVRTAGAVGVLTTDEALNRLLSGTALTFQYLDDNTVTIVPDAEADVGSVPHSDGGSGSSERLQLEEIIVTAQKRSQRLQDVPIPVTALDADTLANSNQLRLQDYYTKIPGLNLVANADGGPMIAMRGIITGGQTSSTVGIVVDDVPYGGSTNTGTSARPPDVDPGDLARIEVLRGPQGTLYGASSIGGLLKFVTLDPSTDRVSGRVQAGFSSVGEGETGYSVRGSINVPLSDTLAVRASGFTVREPGYVDNVQSGSRDVNQLESEGGRVLALWQPSESFSVKLGAMIQDNDRNGPVEVDASLGGPLQVAGLPGTGLYGRKSENYSAIVAGRLGGVELISVTGYNVDTFSNRADIFSAAVSNVANANFGVTGVAAPFVQRVEKFSQEVRASLAIGQRVNWLVGAFYTDEDMLTRLDYVGASSTTGAVAGTVLTVDQPSTFEEYAAFTNITVDVTDRFDVQFGGRVSENEQSFASARSGPAAVIFYGSDPSNIPESRFKDSPATYLVTPRFEVSPDLMVYLRLASGYRPGGPNANCSASIPCNFSADTTQDYEIGVKGSAFDRVLTFDASIYYIDWKDVQINVRNSQLGVIYAANAGRAKSEGVEFAAELKPTTGLTISASGSWSAAELTKDFPAFSPVAGGSGDRLPYSAELSGSLSVDQEFPVGDKVGFIGAAASYVGDRKGLFRSATQVRETYPAYTQVDLRAGVNFDSWSINAYVNNLTDKRGVLNGGLDANRPTFFTYIVPRVAGVNFTKTF